MGVAVLNPQDCLQNPLLSSRKSLISSRPMRSSRNPNPNPNGSNKPQSNRRKRSPNSSRSAVNPKNGGPVMGQVKILKRGEQLPKMASNKEAVVEKQKLEDLNLGSVNRLGPEPDLVHTQIRARLADPNLNKAVGFYAGSAYVASPPPSSVPLPVFFMKKSSVDDATSDLRKILGISL